MMHFAFALDETGRSHTRLANVCRNAWGNAIEHRDREFAMFATEDAEPATTFDPTAIGVVTGWIRREGLAPVGDDPTTERRHVLDLVKAVLSTNPWPLDDTWTGQFAAIAFDPRARRVVVCNDLFGYMPLYVAESGSAVIGGTSLIVLGRMGFNEADPVGVAQLMSRIVSNLAGRTILKGVSRLLPGEHREYALPSLSLTRRFDNSLCKGVAAGSLRDVAEEAWQRYKLEVERAIGTRSRVTIALSGGWDSRLVLAAASVTPARISSVTHGREQLYETRLAKRLANLAQSSFVCVPLENNYFPPVQDYRSLVSKVETANLLQWWPVLSAVPPLTCGQQGELMLLGDYWDILDGRHLDGATSRAERTNLALRALVGLSPRMKPATSASFAHWKDARIAQVSSTVLPAFEDLSENLRRELTPATLRDQIQADLAIDFARVEANSPPFASQYEHLFWWFHRSRYFIGAQGLTLGDRFRTAVPGASFRLARFASTVHPSMLIRRRLLDAIGRLPQLSQFAKIPSATIPWLSLNFPAPLREAVWATRWMADRLLTHRMLRKRDPNARQWVLETQNYLCEYRRPDTLRNIESWFSGRWINPARFVAIARGRAEMTVWPLVNADITVPANVSLLLDLCQNP